MNTKNTVIGVLTIAVVILAVLLFRAHSGGKDAGTRPESFLAPESQFDGRTAQLICLENLKRNDGAPISLTSAQTAIGAFEAINSGDSVKAYYLGIDVIDTLVKCAAAYNGTQAGTQNPVIGYRFYRAITTRLFGRITLNNKSDVVIMPAVASGEDLYVANPNASFPIYSHSRPCPKLCEEKYIGNK